MAFGGGEQNFRGMLADQVHGGNLDEIRGALGEFDAILVAQFLESQHEGFPGEN